MQVVILSKQGTFHKVEAYSKEPFEGSEEILVVILSKQGTFHKVVVISSVVENSLKRS